MAGQRSMEVGGGKRIVWRGMRSVRGMCCPHLPPGMDDDEGLNCLYWHSILLHYYSAIAVKIQLLIPSPRKWHLTPSFYALVSRS